MSAFYCMCGHLGITYIHTVSGSVCYSGRLMRDRSQSTFSVTYKNMKSPSLQSLDNISLDSSLLEDYDSYSLLERGIIQKPEFLGTVANVKTHPDGVFCFFCFFLK